MPEKTWPCSSASSNPRSAASLSSTAGYLLLAFRGMFPTSNEARSRIDDFLPVYDLSADYGIRINAAASVVYECLLRADFNELWVVRLLLSSGTGYRFPGIQNPGGPGGRFRGQGWFSWAAFPKN